MGLIPGSGRSPGGGCGNQLQYSCLENTEEPGWRSLVGYSPGGSQRVGHEWRQSTHTCVYWETEMRVKAGEQAGVVVLTGALIAKIKGSFVKWRRGKIMAMLMNLFCFSRFFFPCIEDHSLEWFSWLISLSRIKCLSFFSLSTGTCTKNGFIQRPSSFINRYWNRIVAIPRGIRIWL